VKNSDFANQSEVLDQSLRMNQTPELNESVRFSITNHFTETIEILNSKEFVESGLMSLTAEFGISVGIAKSSEFSEANLSEAMESFTDDLRSRSLVTRIEKEDDVGGERTSVIESKVEQESSNTAVFIAAPIAAVLLIVIIVIVMLFVCRSTPLAYVNSTTASEIDDGLGFPSDLSEFSGILLAEQIEVAGERGTGFQGMRVNGNKGITE
jgi:hypothetical protein